MQIRYAYIVNENGKISVFLASKRPLKYIIKKYRECTLEGKTVPMRHLALDPLVETLQACGKLTITHALEKPIYITAHIINETPNDTN